MTVLKNTESDILSSLGDPKETTPKALRPHSTPATLLWLEENYETAEGVCIPRSALYMHYVDFCQRNGMQPVNAASFGKIIRQQFPHLTTRRLGTRGQSRYHYYGIAVKETSPYYDISYSKRGCGSVNDLKKDAIKQVFNYGQTMSYSPRNKLGSLLPDFAHLKDIKLPATVPEEKVSTFLMMYRTHCQRILDTVIRASFDEVQSFLQHFWNGMPSHILSIIGSNVIVNIVGVCDSFVYKSICNVLFPTVLQALPDSLIQVIRKFAKELTTWLRTALADLPENIKAIKFDLAKRFSQTLRRQTSLNHLSQASRMVLHNADITGQMLQDWRHVDLDSICRQTLYKVDDQSSNGISLDFVTSLYKEFEGLLEEQAPIEAFMEWLESLVNRCVVQPGMKRRWSLRRLARHFLLMWSSFGTCVIRDMTLHSAPSFGSFHLLHLTFDEYVLYLVESLYLDELTQELLANIPNDAPPNVVDNVFDDAISDSELGMCKIRWFQSQTHGTMTGYLESDHTMGSTTAEILVHSSPVQNIINSNSLITDEAEPGDPQERDCQIMREYSMPVNEHHHSLYHYTTNDARSSCPYGTGINASNRQETKLYTCHPTSQSYTISPPLEGSNGSSNGQVSSYRAADTTANAVDYSNYAPFSSGRRINFAADCRTYYDTSMSTASPMYPIASNTYYQSYEASSSSPICCPSHYNSSPDPPINSVDNNEPNSVVQHNVNVSNGSNGNGHSHTSGKSQGNDAELDEDKVQENIVFAAASSVNNRQ